MFAALMRSRKNILAEHVKTNPNAGARFEPFLPENARRY
jgi:hypothetical protein